MSPERTTADFGARLKEARLRKDVSLRAIADVTRISVAVLEGLERNDISKLPGGIFSRSVVRAYAREVGLDTEATVADFLERFPHDSVTVGHRSSIGWEEMQEAERRRQTIVRRVTYAGLVLLAVSGAVYFGLSRAPRSRPLIEAAGAAVQAMSARAVLPFVSRPSPAAAALTVELVALRACSGTAAADAGLPQQFVLMAGDRRTIEATRELTLTLSEADALDVTINGSKTSRPLGAPGERVVVELTTDNYRAFVGQP